MTCPSHLAQLKRRVIKAKANYRAAENAEARGNRAMARLINKRFAAQAHLMDAEAALEEAEGR